MQTQRALLARFQRPLVCLSMNIPGPVKDSPLIRLAFQEGERRILACATPVYVEKRMLPTGPEGYFVMDIPAQGLKAMAVEAEERDALGRLMDIDVLDAGGEKLARPAQRACLLCGSPAAACARSRAHGLEALTERVKEILMAHAASFYAKEAYRALLAEALTTPKPGLVDGENNGAHADMCLSTLLKSAASLRLFFEEAVRLGMTVPEATLMEALRRAGLRAEADMLQSTGGVNAHKGAIYSLGLLLGAQGACLTRGGNALETAAALAADDLPKQLRQAAQAPHTHGEQIYAQTGVTGVRGEAAAGFPHAVRAAKALRKYAAQGENRAAALALCEVMATLADTNVLHRGGAEGLAFVRARAGAVLALPEAKREEALRRLDREMTKRNLSPGGAADMLALGLYLNAIEALNNFNTEV